MDDDPTGEEEEPDEELSPGQVPEGFVGTWWLQDIDVYTDGAEQTDEWPGSVFWPDSVFYPDSVFMADDPVLNIEKGWYPDSVFLPNSTAFPDSVFQHFRSRLDIAENGSVQYSADVFWDTHGFGGVLGSRGEIQGEPSLTADLSFEEGSVSIAAASGDFATPLASGDGVELWPKNYEPTENGFTLTTNVTVDGTDYEVVETFGSEMPGDPDFGGLRGWWEYDGKENPGHDFLYIGAMDMITTYGLSDGGSAQGPFTGNLVAWFYDDASGDGDGVPQPGELSGTLGLSAGYLRAGNEVTYHYTDIGLDNDIDGNYSFPSSGRLRLDLDTTGDGDNDTVNEYAAYTLP